MLKYMPFITQIFILMYVFKRVRKIKNKKERKYFLLMVVPAQVVVFIGYMKVFLFTYGNIK